MTIQALINWHRTLGVIATIFIFILVISGLALNHSGDLKLDRIYIENDMVLDWYGIAPEKPPVSYRAGGRLITQIDNRIYLDDAEITGNSESLLGAVETEDILVLAFTHSIYLVTRSGDLIENAAGLEGLPGKLQGLGLGPGGEIIIRSGGVVFSSNTDMQAWRPYTETAGVWSVMVKPAGPMEKKLIRMYRGKGLSLEKLLGDLHSGRLFGRPGVYLVDMSGIIFVILSITGWWVWMKRRSMQKEINGKL